MTKKAPIAAAAIVTYTQRRPGAAAVPHLSSAKTRVAVSSIPRNNRIAAAATIRQTVQGTLLTKSSLSLVPVESSTPSAAAPANNNTTVPIVTTGDPSRLARRSRRIAPPPFFSLSHRGRAVNGPGVSEPPITVCWVEAVCGAVGSAPRLIQLLPATTLATTCRPRFRAANLVKKVSGTDLVGVPPGWLRHPVAEQWVVRIDVDQAGAVNLRSHTLAVVQFRHDGVLGRRDVVEAGCVTDFVLPQ